MSIICNSCQTQNPDGSHFCKECGGEIGFSKKPEQSQLQQTEVRTVKEQNKDQLYEKPIDDLLFVPQRKKSSLKKILIILGIGVIGFFALGIIASVVLVAIDPAGRIDEANDAGIKNDVLQVATAVESFYTNQGGTYSGTTGTVVSIPELISGGYLKSNPGTVEIAAAENGLDAVVFGLLSQTSTCVDRYWVYETISGQSGEVCLDY